MEALASVTGDTGADFEAEGVCGTCARKQRVPYEFVENSSPSAVFHGTARNYLGCPVCYEGLDLGNGGRVTTSGLMCAAGELEDVALADTIWFEMDCPACGHYREVYKISGRPQNA